MVYQERCIPSRADIRNIAKKTCIKIFFSFTLYANPRTNLARSLSVTLLLVCVDYKLTVDFQENIITVNETGAALAIAACASHSLQVKVFAHIVKDQKLAKRSSTSSVWP